MDYLIYIVIAVEILAAISGTVFYKKYSHTSLKWLLPLLWYIPLNEFVCQFVLANGQHFIFYNVYEVISSLTILIITYKQIQNKLRKQVVRFLIYGSIAAFVINFIYINPFKENVRVAFTISAILIVIALLYYLIELLKSNKVLNPSKDLFLWICSGFLIFHLSFPVIAFSYLFLTAKSLYLFDALYVIQFVIVVISYVTIAFGFIWAEKRF